MNEAIRDSIPVGKLGLGFLPQSCAHRALQVSRVSGSSLTGVYSSVFAITYLLAYPDGPIGPKSCRQARVELHDDQRLGLQRVGCRWGQVFHDGVHPTVVHPPTPGRGLQDAVNLPFVLAQEQVVLAAHTAIAGIGVGATHLPTANRSCGPLRTLSR